MGDESQNFSDEMLDAYWQGTIDEMTARAIESNQALMQRAVTFLRQHQQDVRLPVVPSQVDGLTLGAYQVGLLDTEEQAFVADLLTQNPAATAELQIMQNYLDDLADDLLLFSPQMPVATAPVQTVASAATSWLQQVREQVEVVMASLVARPISGFALLGDEADQQVYMAGNAQILLRVEDDETLPDHKALYGLLSGIDLTDLQIVVEPLGQAPVVHYAMLTSFGHFVVAPLLSGDYTIRIQKPMLEIYIPLVKV